VVKSVNTVCKSILVSGIVLLAVSAWAESKGSLGLQHPTSVGGKTLATGNYTVRWQGAGDQVQLKIYKGKSEVASLPAHLVQLSATPEYDSAVISNDASGTPSLSEIRFGGKKFALHISGEGGGASSSGASK
jgi:hypothetical protein